MKAPDKIIIVKFRDTKELSDYWVLKNETQNESIEYIRKDAILEWANRILDCNITLPMRIAIRGLISKINSL